MPYILYSSMVYRGRVGYEEICGCNINCCVVLWGVWLPVFSYTRLLTKIGCIPERLCGITIATNRWARPGQREGYAATCIGPRGDNFPTGLQPGVAELFPVHSGLRIFATCAVHVVKRHEGTAPINAAHMQPEERDKLLQEDEAACMDHVTLIQSLV